MKIIKITIIILAIVCAILLAAPEKPPDQKNLHTMMFLETPAGHCMIP